MKKLTLALLPFLAIAILNFWAAANRSRFPDPLATHWGITGAPDGFASLDTHLFWINLVLGLVATLWLLVSFIRVPIGLRALFLALTGYLFLALFALMTQTLVMQLDVADAKSSQFGIELVLWLVPIFALVPLVLSKPKVSVAEQLEVRLRGFRFLKLPLSEIANASVSFVTPATFGGWGIRYANKTTAFVPNRGKALDLELVTGSKILIREDNAEHLVSEIEKRKKAG